MNQVWNIARKELSDGLRNRWLWPSVCCLRYWRWVSPGRRGRVRAAGLHFDSRYRRQSGQPGHLPDAADALLLATMPSSVRTKAAP